MNAFRVVYCLCISGFETIKTFAHTSEIIGNVQTLLSVVKTCKIVSLYGLRTRIMKIKINMLAVLFIVNSSLAVYSFASDKVMGDEGDQRPYNITEQRQPCADYTPLRRPFFGDTHVHTAFSQDASTQATRGTPFDAYRFAKGERVGIQPYDDSGKAMRSQQISVPLDFTAVTDHGEQFGEVRICNDPALQGYDNWVCKVYRHFPRAAFYLMNIRASQMGSRWGYCGEDGENCLKAAATVWQDTQAAAEQAYDRSSACRFTSFNAYEWTGVYDRAANMHRNVIFRNDKVPQLPISFIETKTPLSLLKALDEGCTEGTPGCEVVVIPHNSNLSDGNMFSVNGDDGKALTASEAALRNKYEKLVEIMQHKGSSECYNGAFAGVAADELCDFETLPNVSFDTFGDSPKPDPKTGFVREALRDGLRVQKAIGVNPFQFGIIASTDTHLALPGATEEDRFQGGGGAGKPARDSVPVGFPDKLEYNAGGLAVLYAEENSRDSLFAAMQRREAYGTSGPRLGLRFFGGWDIEQNMCEQTDMVAQGYKKGVPMGGVLPANTGSAKFPSFVVSAQRDVNGQPLQRVQIIKGWVDEKGQSQEKVLEVAGDPSNGAGVDLSSCATHGTGSANLCVVWTDSEFKSSDNAWYYARAVENPSCRWSQRVCNANSVDCSDESTIGEGLEGCCSDTHRPSVQERAWSSPIWYKAAQK